MKNFKKNSNFRHNELFEIIQELYDKGHKKQSKRLNKACEKILEYSNLYNIFIDKEGTSIVFGNEIYGNDSFSEIFNKMKKNSEEFLYNKYPEVLSNYYTTCDEVIKDIQLKIESNETNFSSNSLKNLIEKIEKLGDEFKEINRMRLIFLLIHGKNI